MSRATSRAPSQSRNSHGSPYGQPAPPYAPSQGQGMSSTALSRSHSRHEPPPLSSTAGPMPGTAARPIHGPRKRLIMSCDGTWVNYDNGIMNGKLSPPTNVSRLGWAIKETSRDGIPQIVNYQAGVGTSGGPVSRTVGGATGAGLKEHIRQAYSYISTNWREGDEIFLIGFSRGAYTARSVGATIGDIGLLTRSGIPYFNEIFEDYMNRYNDRYESNYPDVPFRNKGPFDKRYVQELRRLGMTTLPVNIKAICCFETVGPLGVPNSMLAAGRKARGYQFNDTTIHPRIENAFQALALDEHRAPFSPALWEKRSDNDRTNLKQVWFPGVHSNVGGGYPDQEVANITLAWMMSRLEPFLDFRPDFLIIQHQQTVQYYRSTDQRPRWWSFGEIYRSLKGVYALAGSKTRTPGNYQRVDSSTCRPVGKRLKNTNEYIHASVRTRVGLKGPGTDDNGTYEPRALRNWIYEVEPAPSPGQGGNMANGDLVVWHYRGFSDDGGQKRIPEAVLLETELALLRQEPQVEEFVKSGAPPNKRRSRRSGLAGGTNGYAGGGGGGGGGAMNGGGGGGGDNRRRTRNRSLPPGNGARGMGDDNDDDDDDSAAERDRRRQRRRSTDLRKDRNRDRDRDRNRDRDREQNREGQRRRRHDDNSDDDDDDND